MLVVTDSVAPAPASQLALTRRIVSVWGPVMKCQPTGRNSAVRDDVRRVVTIHTSSGVIDTAPTMSAVRARRRNGSSPQHNVATTMVAASATPAKRESDATAPHAPTARIRPAVGRRCRRGRSRNAPSAATSTIGSAMSNVWLMSRLMLNADANALSTATVVERVIRIATTPMSTTVVAKSAASRMRATSVRARPSAPPAARSRG